LCKVATVAFEVEGIREIILPQYHDFIVPQYDIDQLVENKATEKINGRRNCLNLKFSQYLTLEPTKKYPS